MEEGHDGGIGQHDFSRAHNVGGTMNDAYAAEREESRAARFGMSEMDRARRHPRAGLGMCGDEEDARDDYR